MADIKMQLIVDDKGTGVIGRASDRIRSHFDRLGSSVASIAKKFVNWKSIIATLAGGAGIGLLIKKVTDLAAAQELAETKLAQAMRSTGQWSENLMSAYKRQASALQDLTSIGDETILGVMAMLQTFKLAPDVLDAATKATLDLARATGQDFQSAAILMGKAAVGEVSMLTRYGIIVDEAAYKARGFQAVLDEINTEFGGQAQAQAQTYGGRIDALRGYWGDLLEKLGEYITKSPAILAGIEAMINKIKEWIGVIESNETAIKEWVANTYKIIKGWADDLVPIIEKLIDLFVSLPQKLDDVKNSLAQKWQELKTFDITGPGFSSSAAGSTAGASAAPTAGAPVSGADINSIIGAMNRGATITGGPNNTFIINEKVSRSDVNNIVSEANRNAYRGGSSGALSGAGGGF